MVRAVTGPLVPYYAGAKGNVWDWLAELLPYDDVYVEPFGGMGGVLVRRSPSPVEVFNDLNERLWNWMRVVRDDPHRLAGMIERSPDWPARRQYEEAVERLDDADPTIRAYSLFVVCWASRTKTDAGSSYVSFRRGSTPKPFRNIWGLHQRLQKVTLECLDAVTLLERFVNERSAVVYVDPPYPSIGGLYAVDDVDLDALGDVLGGMRGRVAISGYGKEWDGLGWLRHERPVRAVIGQGRRVEVLWTNYKPQGRLW